MPTLSVTDVLRMNGFSPLSQPCGLTKNIRKRRNRKIKHAAVAGPGGLSSLFASTDFNSYIDPMRLKKSVQKTIVSTHLSSLPGFNQTDTAGNGGWGRLPNVATIHYADDDPRGWVTVSRNRRNRPCMIQDDYYEGN
jgi:hypothetical protein